MRAERLGKDLHSRRWPSEREPEREENSSPKLLGCLDAWMLGCLER
jgi:hypothetical protein